MADKTADTALLEFWNGTWDWATSTFWAQMVVGAGSFDANDTTFTEVLSQGGANTLSEYSGATKQAMFALTVNSSGELVPTSSPGLLNFGALAANTAQSNADVRALIINRQLGGSPANSDRFCCWIEDGIQGLQGDGVTPLSFSWSPRFARLQTNPLGSSGKWYLNGMRLILDGTVDFDTDSAAGNLYVRMVVGTGAFDETHQTFNQVTATLGVSEYSNTGYSTLNLFATDTLINATVHRVYSDPATTPGNISYGALFNNIAESHGKVLAMVLCYSPTATPATTDNVLAWIDENIGVDKDGTVLRLNGGDGAPMQFQWPVRFASIESA